MLNALPKSAQSKAKEALHETWMAETRADAQRAFDQFNHTYQNKYPKVTECLEKDREELLAYYDFSATHWQISVGSHIEPEGSDACPKWPAHARLYWQGSCRPLR